MSLLASAAAAAAQPITFMENTILGFVLVIKELFTFSEG
jgi:hypothetical protein